MESGIILTKRRDLENNVKQRKGVSKLDTEVSVKKGELIDRALRRLKKKLDKEGTLKELRNRRHYEKPSEVKRREAKQHRH